jgi:hypothetical protein
LRIAEGELASPPSTTRIRKKTMVSAVSSQAATLNPLAYTALDGDDSSTTTTTTTSNDSGRGPATQVSLSRDAMDLLSAARQSTAPQPLTNSSALQDKFDSINQKFAAVELERQKSSAAAKAQMRDNVIGWLKSAQESYAKWQNTTPVPAVQLTAAQIADVLKKAAPLGFDPSKIGGADTYGFGMDGKIYIFKKDGTAWMNDDGVPTSEQQKQDSLVTRANGIQFLTDYLRDNGTV